MTISQEKLKKGANKLPEGSGVYKFFGSKNRLLYIGKATSLRSRVRSYFAKDLAEKRSPLISKMMEEARKVKFEKTASVLEALILEARLIKKFAPPFNTADKDQKSWNFVVITDEKFPRVLIMREKELATSPPSPLSFSRRGGTQTNIRIKEKFGPFTNGRQLKEALKIVRKIFPFRDRCNPLQEKPCFNYQIGLCPGVCAGEISEKDYKKNIKRIIQFFQGKKQILIKELVKEMRLEAKEKKFEKAAEIKRKKIKKKHINDVALVRDSNTVNSTSNFRIEAYDIAHISGANMVGGMTVIENGEINKNQYRMFKIKGQKVADDTKALKEVLERRLKHSEWRTPDMIVVDGGKAQINAAIEKLKDLNIENLKIAAVTKDERHKPKEVIDPTGKHEREILLANSEAHRFAIKYHRKLRENYGK